MKKVIEETKTVERVEYYCDVCGNRMDSLDLKFCDVCNKYLCVQCAIRSEDPFDGESPSYYCLRCWNIGDIYRCRIADERAKRDINIATLECKWMKAGKEEIIGK